MPDILKTVGLVADRATIQEASDYLETIAGSLRKHDRVGLFTGAFVLYNTAARIANEHVAAQDKIIQRLVALGEAHATTDADKALIEEAKAIITE